MLRQRVLDRQIPVADLPRPANAPLWSPPSPISPQFNDVSAARLRTYIYIYPHAFLHIRLSERRRCVLPPTVLLHAPSPPPTMTTTTGHVLGLRPYRLAQLFSATSLAFFFGASGYSSISVMPSLIDAPLSTHQKLSFFKHMILRGNAIIPPALLSAIASLAYLAYSAPLHTSRQAHLLALGALVATLGLQVPILPKNKAMVEIADRGKGKGDDGSEANWRIAELSRWNLGRVALSGIAFVITAWEMIPRRDGVPLPVRL